MWSLAHDEVLFIYLIFLKEIFRHLKQFYGLLASRAARSFWAFNDVCIINDCASINQNSLKVLIILNSLKS